MSCRIPSLSVLALAALLGLIWPATAQERAVNVYNWTDYIDPAAIERFQKETGIQVRYDVYDSLETLEGKLLAGSSGYDVVVPTSEPTFSRLIKVGALQPIDWKRVPNRAGLDPTLMQRVASSDPGTATGPFICGEPSASASFRIVSARRHRMPRWIAGTCCSGRKMPAG